jgi:aspartyl-tRNA(Asn)/glutamyl-tRNA(Gln) amidotransferase subunit A
MSTSLGPIPTLAAASRMLATRKISALELTKAMLDRIAAHDPKLNAFLLVTAERALNSARAADRAIRAGKGGVLTGIPLAYKDIYETEGVRTTAHSRILADNVPKRDAETIRRLGAAGAVMLGKLATHEFAIGGPAFDLPWPPARNPWDPRRFTGGSSSGSGAAVASGMALGSLGSDTGGSIRLPAAFCGIAGLKPTPGLVSRRGVIPLSPSLDTAGPMAWTAEDCALLMDVIAGYDPEDPASVQVPEVSYSKGLDVPVKGMRVGVLRGFVEKEAAASPEALRVLANAIAALKSLGCTVEDASLPSLHDYNAVGRVIISSEAYAMHEGTLKTRIADHSRALRIRVLPGALLRAADYIAAQRQRTDLIATTSAAFRKFDVLLTLPVAAPAPMLTEQRQDDGFARPLLTTFANVAALPALVVCGGFTATGLPLGVEFVGPAWADATLLRLGHQFERATGTRDTRPKL